MENEQLLEDEQDKKMSELAIEIQKKINSALSEHPILGRPIAVLLASFVCCMVLEHFGESQKSQDELNELMGQAWKASLSFRKKIKSLVK